MSRYNKKYSFVSILLPKALEDATIVPRCFSSYIEAEQQAYKYTETLLRCCVVHSPWNTCSTHDWQSAVQTVQTVVVNYQLLITSCPQRVLIEMRNNEVSCFRLRYHENDDPSAESREKSLLHIKQPEAGRRRCVYVALYLRKQIQHNSRHTPSPRKSRSCGGYWLIL